MNDNMTGNRKCVFRIFWVVREEKNASAVCYLSDCTYLFVAKKWNPTLETVDNPLTTRWQNPLTK